MSERITDLGSARLARLFSDFEHTAYRLETLQHYDVGYELEPYAAFLAGKPRPDDPSKGEWTAMIRQSVAAGKVLQRVHAVAEPLTDYLRYELEWSYEPNVAAGEDIRILLMSPGGLSGLPPRDYWLFDSRDLWIMEYDSEGRFLHAEQDTDASTVVRHTYWRDAALHHAIPYPDYMHRAQRAVP